MQFLLTIKRKIMIILKSHYSVMSLTAVITPILPNLVYYRFTYSRYKNVFYEYYLSNNAEPQSSETTLHVILFSMFGFTVVFIKTHGPKKNAQVLKTTAEGVVCNTLQCARAGRALRIFITQNGVGGGWACPTVTAASRHFAISGLHSVPSAWTRTPADLQWILITLESWSKPFVY